MALNLSHLPTPSSTAATATTSSSASPFLLPKPKHLIKLSSFPSRAASPSRTTLARSDSTDSGRITEEESPPASFTDSLSSARTQLDLLEQLTSTSTSKDGYESYGGSRKLTIRDQLAQLVGDRDGDFTIPLGRDLKKMSAKFLTISQKRNIRRQAYLDEVAQRNDSVFFATIGAFVILPPLVILGIAILTGYVQLFP